MIKTTVQHKKRLKIRLFGAVQGVGFRPFVYRLARELHLTGWVNNSPQGVNIEVEGDEAHLQQFLLRLHADKPPAAFIQNLEFSFLDPVGFPDFQILQSEQAGEKTALVLPDIATCPDCLQEIFDPDDRRYLYPFTNCTNCGPRFSIIEALPYDRPNTSMKKFKMCPECQAEYEDPGNRRFHAQPNACSRCGPHLELWNEQGEIQATHHEALLRAAEAIRQGQIVAVKGLGGFHLMVDARNEAAVQRLRQRKHREEKPFALMAPSLEWIEQVCRVSDLEVRLLSAPEAPIVLLQKRSPTETSAVSRSVAPNNPYLGIMLPYTPLHHILLRELNIPVVATSGNLSDEPICTDEREALSRLSGIADLFLVHNRPIVRHVDDSIVRVLKGRELVLRRARGYAPLPLTLPQETNPILAVGAHLKNSVAIAVKKQIFISQHIGDLETEAAFQAFQKVIESFKRLYQFTPEAIACDAHPDYLSTKFAETQNLPVIPIQHHYAHILACMAENELAPPVLGVSWDGTGYGLDGTVWGGEFLLVDEKDFRRLGHFRTFPLPGGERAIKEPRRTALGLLYEMQGEALFQKAGLPTLTAFREAERRTLQQMLRRRTNCPLTSSAGRLFDAVASLINLRQIIRFEGQAAMELEFILPETPTEEAYPLKIDRSNQDNRAAQIIDWAPMIEQILIDFQNGVSGPVISARFHNALTEVIVAIAKEIGIPAVALSGGCFQNRYLTERTVDRLQQEGFRPYWHQRIPPNDGGISAGQIVGADKHLRHHQK